MQVLNVVPVGLDIVQDDVWPDGADFDQAVVLDEDGVAGEVSMHNRGRAGFVQVAQGGQDLGAPTLPRLKLDFAVVFLGATKKLLK